MGTLRLPRRSAICRFASLWRITVRNPELTEAAVLGAIVAIRTVISFFLNRELEQEGIQKNGNWDRAYLVPSCLESGVTVSSFSRSGYPQ